MKNPQGTNFINRAIYDFLKETGLKKNEKFHVLNRKGEIIGTFYFSEDNEFYCVEMAAAGMKTNVDTVLKLLLKGHITAQALVPFMPVKGDTYYFIKERKGAIEKYDSDKAVWNDTLDDISRNLMGNCFRNENESNGAILGYVYSSWQRKYNELKAKAEETANQQAQKSA